MLALDSKLLIEDVDEGISKSKTNITWNELKGKIKKATLRKEIEKSLNESGFFYRGWGKTFLEIRVVN